ncbi:MAG: transcriptional repressor [Clostridia bacterium]|nr:transcriptional repressor [Clostridia bacterium]
MSQPEKTKQKRQTKQKQAIFNIVSSSTSHPTAEMIFRQAQKQVPSISLGTVYRNLQELVSEGKVIELFFNRQQSHYDGQTKPHCHYICESCGKVYDLPLPETLQCLDKLSGLPGKVSEYRLEIFGICDNCRSK